MQNVVKYIISTLLIAFVCNTACTQVTTSYTINDDLLKPYMLCLKKHSKGYLLVGTSHGLYRFNGSSFSPFNTSQLIKDKSVTAIAEDVNSTVWLGFKSGEIGLVRNDSVILLNAQEGHPAVAITSIVADPAGTIYFTTAGEGIYYYYNKRFYNINTDDGLTDNYIYDISIDNNGVTVCTDRGLNTVSISNGKKRISAFTSSNGLKDNIVRCFYPVKNESSNSGSYWLGMQDSGIARYNINNSQSFRYINNWKYGQINSIAFTGKRLWVATENNGIVIINCSNNFSGGATTTEYLGFAKARNLISDDEGNIWFTSNHQLVKTNGEKLQNIIPIANTLFPQIHTILSDNKRNIWINTDKGLIKYRFNTINSKWQSSFISLNVIDSKTDITCLYEDKFGNIWIGTMGKGITVIDPITGKSRTLTEDKLLINASILSINGRGDEIWISSLEGAIHCNLGDENENMLKPYTFLNFKNVSSLGSNYIYSIFIDSKNRVWFATDGRGITVYNGNKFKNYNESNGIKSLVIYNICEDKNGNIWFSALNNGLYKFDGKTFTNISQAQGLNDLTITALATDAKNNIIAISKKGVNIINAETNNISYLDADQGLQEVNTDLNCITGTDALYFVSNKGIMSYEPAFKSLKPKIVLESVQLFLKDIDFHEVKNFPYNENNLKFSYTAVSFSHPDKVQYQYKLEGLSNEWVTTKDRSLNLPKLPPGKYIFRVRASLNGFFAKSDEAVYSFVIQKPFWLQWWFIAAGLIISVSLLFLVIRNREKRVKRWERIEREKIQSQFETLKSQVNPHFLFNSFNTLISVIEDDQQKAVEYVERLSDLYRKIVNYRDKDVITLKEEIEISSDYFFIQQKRFGHNLKFINNITANDQLSYMIAPLTLQLLTENAVKHNSISWETPLIIRLSIFNNRLVIENNLNPKFIQEKGGGMGLQNIQNRYKLLSKEEVIISKTSNSFIVTIPLLRNYDEHEDNINYRRRRSSL